jgi:hypothetical protein
MNETVTRERRYNGVSKTVAAVELGLQQITRIPPFWPGSWVKVGTVPRWVKAGTVPPSDLAGRVLRVRALTASADVQEKRIVWHVHLGDGRCVRAELIERLATEAEIRAKRGRPEPDGT